MADGKVPQLEETLLEIPLEPQEIFSTGFELYRDVAANRVLFKTGFESSFKQRMPSDVKFRTYIFNKFEVFLRKPMIREAAVTELVSLNDRIFGRNPNFAKAVLHAIREGAERTPEIEEVLCAAVKATWCIHNDGINGYVDNTSLEMDRQSLHFRVGKLEAVLDPDYEKTLARNVRTAMKENNLDEKTYLKKFELARSGYVTTANNRLMEKLDKDIVEVLKTK